MRLRTGKDVRTLGSGNAGARNVLRGSGKADAVATLVIDLMKGSVAVLLGRLLVHQEWAGALAFVSVIVGHIWPAQLSFRGGKGVTTALGAMLVVDARVALLALVGGTLVGGVARSTTVFGLTGIAIAPAIFGFLGASQQSVIAVAVGCALVLIAHHPSFDRHRQAFGGLATPTREKGA